MIISDCIQPKAIVSCLIKFWFTGLYSKENKKYLVTFFKMRSLSSKFNPYCRIQVQTRNERKEGFSYCKREIEDHCEKPLRKYFLLERIGKRGEAWCHQDQAPSGLIILFKIQILLECTWNFACKNSIYETILKITNFYFIWKKQRITSQQHSSIKGFY